MHGLAVPSGVRAGNYGGRPAGRSRVGIRYALHPEARERELELALDEFNRVALCGGPNTGKTTLAERVTDRVVITTDTWRDEPWATQPGYILDACAPHERFLLEGVQVVRALRKGLEVDCLLWLVNPVAECDARQTGMAKGLATIFEGIREELAKQIPIVVIP